MTCEDKFSSQSIAGGTTSVRTSRVSRTSRVIASWVTEKLLVRLAE
jgi:hypothetical protein